MRVLVALMLVFCAICLCGCSQPPPKTVEAPAKSAAPEIPADVTEVAKTLLGSDAEVLIFGDLAKTGKQQLVTINRLPKTPPGVAPGILFTRLVVAENDQGKWKEVLRCDEHLKNPKGFLGLTPLVPVSGWRLQYEQDTEKGLQLYFIPLQPATGGAHVSPIGVRWNPATKRYQSLDRTYQHFLNEVPALETLPSHLR
ncbi:MAG TPA: hypothetical protein VOA41_09710 [Candidatus Dormibacteraeota bacterium]|nr:hypothetical protein [Candidatus Dormibacteraeota bacterium]